MSDIFGVLSEVGGEEVKRFIIYFASDNRNAMILRGVCLYISVPVKITPHYSSTSRQGTEKTTIKNQTEIEQK